MITRPATAADVPVIVALVNSTYRGTSGREGWTTEADLLDGQRTDIEGLTATIAAPDNVVLMYEQRGALVGCVHVQRQDAHCYLGMLTIRPAAQGVGLGSELLDAAERWATSCWSSRSVHLGAIAQRPEVIAWYERRGYLRTGEQQPFPYGDIRFGLPRRDDLVFDVLRKPLSAVR